METTILKPKPNITKTAQTNTITDKVNVNIFADRVEKKAYELYEKRGCQEGHHLDDWFEALKIVEDEMIAGK